MEIEIFKILGKIGGIGGIALGIFLLLFRDVIAKKIFPALTKKQAYRTIRLFLILTFLISLAGISAWLFSVMQRSGPAGNIVIHEPAIEKNDEESKEIRDRIIKLIMDISEKMGKKGEEHLPDSEDTWTSRPVNMAVFGYISKNNKGLKDNVKLQQLNELIARRISSGVESKSTISIVDRRHLEEILTEQQLALFDMLDEKHYIEIGRIFGARIFLFSELIPHNDKYEIDISIVDTETTKRSSFMYTLKNEAHYKEAAGEIAVTAINKIKQHYSPGQVKGRITSVDESDKVGLNIGSQVGIRPGHVLKVCGEWFGDDPLIIGFIEVVEVRNYTAMARIIQKKRPFKVGDKVLKP